MMRADPNAYPGRKPVYVTRAFERFNVGDVIYPPAAYAEYLIGRGLVGINDPLEHVRGPLSPEPAPAKKRGRPSKAK